MFCSRKVCMFNVHIQKRNRKVWQTNICPVFKTKFLFLKITIITNTFSFHKNTSSFDQKYVPKKILFTKFTFFFKFLWGKNIFTGL